MDFIQLNNERRTTDMSKIKQQKYIENRNQRIVTNIQEHLGPSHQLPKTRPQFEALHRIKDADQRADVWALACLHGDRSPKAISTIGWMKGKQEKLVTEQDGKQEKLVTEQDGKQEKLVTSRLEKLRYAVDTMSNLETVHQFAVESHDLDTLQVYLGLLEALDGKVGMGYALLVKARLELVRGLIGELD
jgi:hypothetical protein